MRWLIWLGGTPPLLCALLLGLARLAPDPEGATFGLLILLGPLLPVCGAFLALGVGLGLWTWTVGHSAFARRDRIMVLIGLAILAMGIWYFWGPHVVRGAAVLPGLGPDTSVGVCGPSYSACTS